MPEAAHRRGQVQWEAFCGVTIGGNKAPDSITYRKDPATGFYEIRAYNKEPDREPA